MSKQYERRGSRDPSDMTPMEVLSFCWLAELAGLADKYECTGITSDHRLPLTQEPSSDNIQVLWRMYVTLWRTDNP